MERLSSFQHELLQSARLGSPSSAQSRLRISSPEEGGISARPSGDDTSVPPGSPGLDEQPQSGFADAVHAERKGHTFAALSAALDLSELDPQQRTQSGGTFLPILPLATDEDSLDRGLPTMPTDHRSTSRWGVM